MEYPIFEVPFIGGSLLIAGVAIFHVFIAQFSVGSGFFMVIAEKEAVRKNDTDTLAFLKNYSLLVLLVPYVLGTVTGAGIWFVVAMVGPRSISLLIHQFVWDWAMEWVVFIIEVVTIYLYFFTWDKVSPRTHNRIGWIFAIASLFTLVIVNGILSFMLTPGSWAPFIPFSTWKGFLNPSYFPTTLIRILISLALAGVGGIVLSTFAKGITESTREKIGRLSYRMIVPSILCPLLLGWTFLTIPDRAKTFVQGGSAAMTIFPAFGMAAFAILLFGVLLGLWRRDYRTSTLGSCLLVLFAFVSYGSFEFVREGIRKPYIIEGFMYSTGVTTEKASGIDPRANIESLKKRGVLSAAPWALPAGTKVSDSPDDLTIGRSVFRASCLCCHQIDGYNAIRPLMKGWSADTTRRLLDNMSEIKPCMPPFPGTEEEKKALVTYLEGIGADTEEERAE